MPSVREIDRRDRSLALVVFGVLFAAYLLTYTGVIQSSDGLAMFATAESMVRRGAIDSNQLLWMGNQQGNLGPDGNLYSRKGLGMTLLAVPLVWLASFWPGVGAAQAALLLNPLLTAVTGALLFRAGRRLGWRRRTSVAVALIFGLATLAWPYTQTLFSDPVCGFGLAAGAYGLLSYSQTARKRYLVLGALAWGVAYLARVVNLVTLPIFLAALAAAIFAAEATGAGDLPRAERPASTGDAVRRLFLVHWRPLVSYLIPVVLVGVISLWWNWARYGSLWDSGYVESERFDGVWWAGVFGLLVGPGRGLLWYSPALALAAFGVPWFWRRARVGLYVCAAIVLVYVLLYGKWYMWHGGYSWGPRFLVPALPFLALLIGPAWEAWMVEDRRGPAVQFVVWLLVALSVGVQWLGMLIPFSLVQDWLAANVTLLFAPETFTRIEYSPLVLQWRFLAPETLIFAWWRGRGAWPVDWTGLLLPLAGLIVGALLLARHLREPDRSQDRAQRAPAVWLYPVALAAMAVVLLINYQVRLTDPELRRAASRIAHDEQSGDAVLLLLPAQSQAFADAYHGRLPSFGFFPHGDLDAESAAWLERLRSEYDHLWVLPDDTSPEQSGWERLLRGEDFLLLDTRMAEPGGQRLALYTMSERRDLQEAGLGTVFGDPALVEQGISEENGWFRLDGYAFTPATTAGGELLLELRWQSLRPVDYDYQVFVHLLNAADEKLAQRDGQPVQWLRPTSTWHPGEDINDRYGLLLPPDLPAGGYTIAVGLYDPVSGQRLPVSAGPRDYAIEIGPIQVEAGR
jgi:hypothetical protein